MPSEAALKARFNHDKQTLFLNFSQNNFAGYRGEQCKSCKRFTNLVAHLGSWVCPCGQVNSFLKKLRPHSVWTEPDYGPTSETLKEVITLAHGEAAIPDWIREKEAKKTFKQTRRRRR